MKEMKTNRKMTMTEMTKTMDEMLYQPKNRRVLMEFKRMYQKALEDQLMQL